MAQAITGGIFVYRQGIAATDAPHNAGTQQPAPGITAAAAALGAEHFATQASIGVHLARIGSSVRIVQRHGKAHALYLRLLTVAVRRHIALQRADALHPLRRPPAPQ